MVLSAPALRTIRGCVIGQAVLLQTGLPSGPIGLWAPGWACLLRRTFAHFESRTLKLRVILSELWLPIQGAGAHLAAPAARHVPPWPAPRASRPGAPCSSNAAPPPR